MAEGGLTGLLAEMLEKRDLILNRDVKGLSHGCIFRKYRKTKTVRLALANISCDSS